MGCCNEQRNRSATPPALPVGFEYVGATALTVVGPITRTHYRFPSPGARVQIDPRDAPYVAGVPNLRRIQT
jgi:hypothetical protein